MKLLLERGAYVNENHLGNGGPIQIALNFKQTELACILLEHGAEATSIVLDKAISLYKGDARLVEMILQRLRYSEQDGAQLLLRAARYGHEKIVKLLLNYGMRVRFFCDCLLKLNNNNNNCIIQVHFEGFSRFKGRGNKAVRIAKALLDHGALVSSYILKHNLPNQILFDYHT